MPEAHALNQAAANALLKTLEEPPAATYFLLGSHAAGWVPKTILSRCQKLRFSPLPAGELEAVLRAQGREFSPDQLTTAQGSARAALRQADLPEDYPSLVSLYDRNSPFGVAEAYALAQDLSEGERLLPFLESLLQQAHQWLTGPNGEAAPSFELLTFAERILEFRREMRQNANPKLHIPRLLMFFKEPVESRL
jgi:DNA polymerase III gamma/tau subunit